MSPARKLEALRRNLAEGKTLAVAFSGGVDSAFLLHVAAETLPGRVLALTLRSPLLPRRDFDGAVAFCRERRIRHAVLDADPFAIPGFDRNPTDRCYRCKRELFARLKALAAANGFPLLADGSNASDAPATRPGSRALRELGIASPLRDAGLSKPEIRDLSRQMDLPTWNKPSAACLATRFPFGERLSPDGLARVERAENAIRNLFPALGQLRARVHGDLARIEVSPDAFPALLARREEISASLEALGFRHVSLDLRGYREAIPPPPPPAP